MDKISNVTSLITEIVKIYSDKAFQRELKSQMEVITERFYEILSLHANEVGLLSSNSVRPVKYFSVTGRIKEEDSFHEKMIRGNLIYEFIEKGNLRSTNDIRNHVAKIRTLIKEICDDIIGIKILTEVEKDCMKVSSILKNEYLLSLNNKAELFLDKDELEKQPQKMRNGFLFYKIPGIFSTTFKFELQIKSKLLSVWGDMDHSMFYKDYSVSPIKENVKESMLHLGNLIIQVDEFLLQIREANKNFYKNREAINFIEEFSSKYSEYFKDKLGFGYRFEEISEVLFHFYKKLLSIKKTLRPNLDYSILTLKCETKVNKDYLELRNKDFNLQILELIYFNWFIPSYKARAKKSQQYDRNIASLLDEYLIFIKNKISGEYVTYLDFISENLLNTIEYFNEGSLFYKSEKINSFFETYKIIEDYSDFDIRFEDDVKKAVIRTFFLLVFFKHKAREYLQQNAHLVSEDELSIALSKIKLPYENKELEELKTFKSAEGLIRKSLLVLK